MPTGELSDVGYSIMTNVKRVTGPGLKSSEGFKTAEFLEWDLGPTISRNKILVLWNIMSITLRLMVGLAI